MNALLIQNTKLRSTPRRVQLRSETTSPLQLSKLLRTYSTISMTTRDSHGLSVKSPLHRRMTQNCRSSLVLSVVIKIKMHPSHLGKRLNFNQQKSRLSGTIGSDSALKTMFCIAYGRCMMELKIGIKLSCQRSTGLS